jgi:predicted neutral ceramidase superfamily lipid hydrolase
MVLRLRMELDDEPVLTVLLVWWPIVIYLGWIMVATIACISSWLVYIDWQPLNIRQDVWTMIMIAISTSLFAILVKTRNQREAALVGAWAFIAIAVRHKQNHIDILITSLVCTIILLTIIALHGYKHRDTNLLSKAKRGEWY